MPAEAAIIRRIFQEIAEGRGFSRIAKGLNAEAVPCPAPGRGWATSGVRELVLRTCTAAASSGARLRWVDRGGTKVKQDVPASEWLVLERPELRIVGEDLWRAAHARARPHPGRIPAPHRRPLGGPGRLGDADAIPAQHAAECSRLRRPDARHEADRAPRATAALLRVHDAPGAGRPALPQRHVGADGAPRRGLGDALREKVLDRQPGRGRPPAGGELRAAHSAVRGERSWRGAAGGCRRSCAATRRRSPPAGRCRRSWRRSRTRERRARRARRASSARAGSDRETPGLPGALTSCAGRSAGWTSGGTSRRGTRSERGRRCSGRCWPAGGPDADGDGRGPLLRVRGEAVVWRARHRPDRHR